MPTNEALRFPIKTRATFNSVRGLLPFFKGGGWEGDSSKPCKKQHFVALYRQSVLVILYLLFVWNNE